MAWAGVLRGSLASMPPIDPHEASRLEQSRLEEAMKETPKGALALSGAAVLLLLIAWFSIYLFVFLPRGPVG